MLGYVFEHFVPDVVEFEEDLQEEFGANYLSITEEDKTTTIYFDTALTPDEEDNLNTMVENHEPQSTGFLIYELLPKGSLWEGVDHKTLPKDLNYNTGLNQKLYTDYTIVKGAPTEFIRYKTVTYDAQGARVFSDPVVKEEFYFVHDPAGLPIQRKRKIRWIDTAGVWSTDYKLMVDAFSPEQSIAEAVKRRSNVISTLKPKIVGSVMLTEGLSQADAIAEVSLALITYDLEIQEYIAWNTQTLYDKVTDDVSTLWFDNDIGGLTIRGLILMEISL